MATSGTGALAASNYDTLDPKEKKDLTLTQEGDTLKVSDKKSVRGLALKSAGQINKFDLQKGKFSAFNFTGGTGRDSLAIGKKAKSIGTIDLGNDNASDVVNIQKKSGFKGVIRNFKSDDKLIVKGKEYTLADVKNGEIQGLGGIKFA